MTPWSWSVRIRDLVLAAVFVMLVASCEKGGPIVSGTGGAQGQVGHTFVVSVGKPANGTVTSADGAIRCGTGGDACVAVFSWSVSVVLTATPDEGFGLQSWAGDCSHLGECVLDTTVYGADKFVFAAFNPLDRLGHGNWTTPELHAPGYRNFVAQAPGALQCTNCHGADLMGQGIAPSCDACHATNGLSHWKASASCTACHGDANRTAVAGADPSVTAAPPADTHGNTSTVFLSVGAHATHLNSARVRPVACSECHTVPASTSHADGTVTVTFGTLAKTDGANPAWTGGSCSATYCHGATLAGGTNTSPSWIGGAAQATCGSCHGLPPPAPHTTSTNCGGCHAGYTASSVDPVKHIDGTVQVSSGGGAPACGTCHGVPPPAPHTTSTTCGSCHTGYTSTVANVALHQNGTVDVISAPSCGSCHGIPPPAPHTTSTTCGSCHTGYTATAVNTALHQNGTVNVTMSCTSCHGAPPPAPHSTSTTCGNCHSGYTSTSANAALHQNGTVDVISAPSCGSCHGIPPPAPHTTSTTCGSCHTGYTSTTTNATLHQNGTVDVISAPSCGSCHGIPPPAPHTTSTTCGNCHTGYTSTTTNATLHQNGTVDVISTPSCGSCHGIPPPAPHTTSTTCGNCHTGYTSTTVNATLHQNGTVNVTTSCTSCHGAPPATGEHRRSQHVSRSCGDCHPGYTTTTANATTHQNGTAEVGNRITSFNTTTKSCTSTCHGGETW